MNHQETEKLLMAMQEMYFPQTKSTELDLKGFEMRVKMWQRQFDDVPFVDVFRAFEIHIGNSRYAPSVSDLKMIVAKIQNPDLFMSGEAAWDIVSNLCVSFGFNGQTEAYKHLNQRMKDVIKATGGWWEHCYNEAPHLLRKRFIETWETKFEAERQKVLMPNRIVKYLEQSEEKHEPKQLPEV